MQVQQVRVQEAPPVFSKLAIACLASITTVASLTIFLVASGQHQAAAWLVFGTVLAFVFLEHYTGVSKSAVAMTGMGVLFLIAKESGLDFASSATQRHIQEMFSGHYGIVLFLLSAMLLIEVVNHYGAFDLMQAKILSLGLSDTKQAAVILTASCILSASIDNLTTALIMVAVSALFFQGGRFVLVSAGVVNMANIGGAPSPIGDVTTVMLWMGGKFTPLEVLTHTGPACLIMASLIMVWVLKTINTPDSGKINHPDAPTEYKPMTGTEKLVVGVSFVGFSFPLFSNLLFGIPFLGLLFAAGLVWVLVNALRKFLPQHITHLEAEIDEGLTKRLDMSSIWFFAAILGCVGALEIMHCLEGLMHGLDHTLVALGITGAYSKALAVCTSLGVMSAFLDNIPLVAIAMKIMQTNDPAIWSLLALTAGTGGSMLITGSAAGVVAMKKCPGLTFTGYLKTAGKISVLAYAAGILVWTVQHYYLFT